MASRTRLAGIVGALCAALLCLGLPAVASAALKPVTVKHSLLGTHRWYVQTYRGMEVLGGFVAEHQYSDGRTEWTEGRRPVSGKVSSAPAISKSRAGDIGRRAAKADRVVTAPEVAVLPGTSARLVWVVIAERKSRHDRVLVDATTGAVIRVEPLAADATGTGRVFDPNPVVTLRDPTLTDQNDADYPALAGAYRDETLTHLDGSGFLRGDFASIDLPDEDSAFSPALSFSFNRSSPFFEQVMAYHHVTRAQEYIQSLGFADLNSEPQGLLPDLFNEDNSFYDSFFDVIVFGTGGVDDAEDADVIWHEYGHAMQGDQFIGDASQSPDVAAIGEGFGDYWAVTMSQPVNAGFDVPCFADWGSFGNPLTHCSRRVDEDVTVADRSRDPHDNGRIWSRALWDVNQALGRDVANRIVLEAQFAYAPTMRFSDAAQVTVSTARRLYGAAAAKVVRDAFEARGIDPQAPPAHPAHPLHPLRADIIATVGDPAPDGGSLEGDFEIGGLNASGVASFTANLLVDGDFIGQGAFASDGTSLSELARSGDPAPGGGTYGIGTEGPVVVNSLGDVAFGFALEPFEFPFGANSGVYLQRRGQTGPEVVARPDAPAPGGGAFLGAFEAAMNNDREIAFTGITESSDGYTPGLGSGVFVAAPGGSITKVAAPGDAAPGGGSIDYAAGGSINAGGDVAFSAHVASDPELCQGAGFLNCSASVFLRDGETGVTQAVARQGGPAPAGTDSGFRSTQEPLVNDSGDVLFFATLSPSLDAAVVLRKGGTTRLIARDLQTLPHIGEVTTVCCPSFRPAVPDFALNNRGQVAFIAGLLNTSAGFGVVPAIVAWEAGDYRLLVAPGTTVQGVGTIENFLPGIVLNDRGQLLFQALLDDGRQVLLRTR